MFNEAVWHGIKQEHDPLIQLYMMLNLNDDELRYYRILDEWDRDRKNRASRLSSEIYEGINNE